MRRWISNSVVHVTGNLLLYLDALGPLERALDPALKTKAKTSHLTEPYDTQLNAVGICVGRGTTTSS